MEFFYDDIVFTTVVTKIKNNIGQVIETYVKSSSIKCDIQPSTEEVVKKTFGEDIKANYLMFTGTNLALGQIVVYDNLFYEIGKKLNYIDYKIYTLKLVDINVTG